MPPSPPNASLFTGIRSVLPALPPTTKVNVADATVPVTPDVSKKKNDLLIFTVAAPLPEVLKYLIPTVLVSLAAAVPVDAPLAAA